MVQVGAFSSSVSVFLSFSSSEKDRPESLEEEEEEEEISRLFGSLAGVPSCELCK